VKRGAESGEAALRAIATYEASKGLAALAAALGLLALLHRDLHHLALEWIGHFHLNPTSPYPAEFLAAVDATQSTPTATLLALAGLYIAARFIEAFGLWHARAWGEWFGALSGGIYVPFELRHVARHPSWQAALVLVFNLCLVAYLVFRIRRRRRTS
jgi:uncharacterized membrane protein (DUF2068 family)